VSVTRYHAVVESPTHTRVIRWDRETRRPVTRDHSNRSEATFDVGPRVEAILRRHVDPERGLLALDGLPARDAAPQLQRAFEAIVLEGADYLDAPQVPGNYSIALRIMLGALLAHAHAEPTATFHAALVVSPGLSCVVDAPALSSDMTVTLEGYRRADEELPT